jgi:hypothetical protein
MQTRDDSLRLGLQEAESETIRLADYADDVYSQFGEDGILKKLLSELGISSGVFCEFGAWDAKFLSNTRHLLDGGWKGLYIEGDRDRYADLVRNVHGLDVEAVCAFVTAAGEHSLDNIFARSALVGSSRRLDLLSIDIDSDDLAVWRGLGFVRPTVVIIEYNPTIPLDVRYENPVGQFKGNSAAAIHELATVRKYDLVASTTSNLIYVANELRPRTVPALTLSDVRGPRYFWGYDGSLMVCDTQGASVVRVPELIKIPWKPAFFPQPTPPLFRGFEQPNTLNHLNRMYSIARAYRVGMATTADALFKTFSKARRQSLVRSLARLPVLRRLSARIPVED